MFIQQYIEYITISYNNQYSVLGIPLNRVFDASNNCNNDKNTNVAI